MEKLLNLAFTENLRRDPYGTDAKWCLEQLIDRDDNTRAEFAAAPAGR